MRKTEKTSKRILIIASDLKTLLRFRLHMIQAFIAQGLAVFVVIPKTSEGRPETEPLSRLGVTLIGIDIENTKLHPVVDLALCFKLYRTIRTIKPDFVLSYTIKPVIYGSFTSYLARVPHIFAMITGIGSALLGETLKRKVFQYFIKFLYRFSLPHCEKVFFQNPDDASLFLKNKLVKPEKIVRINGSGVDLDYYKKSPLPPQISFLFVGRLIREKGIFEFIEAAKNLHQKYPHVQCTILGGFHSNPTHLIQSHFFELVKEAGVDFVNEVSDVRPYLTASSVFVFPSYYGEGVPRASLEALAMGRPLITTDHPGCRETVIEGVNGFLVPIKNVAALVEKMEFFIQNPEQCKSMGLASRQLASDQFDVHKVNAIILKHLIA